MVLLVSCCAKAPDSPEVMLERARILMDRGRAAEAIPVLDNVLKTMQQSPDAHYQRGLAYENLDLPEKALADYVACLKLDHLRTDALNNKAVQLVRLKRYDEAIAAFTELVDLDREDFLGYRNRGLCRFDMHDTSGALQDYETALKLNPEDPSSWFQRGNVHLSMDNLDAAESDFSRSLELDPEFAKAWMNRGVVRYRKGQKPLAAEDLTRAQELDSNIVVPSVDFFGDTQPSAAATEVVASSVWGSCRPVIEAELADRGFTQLVFVREFPDLQCAELTGEFDGTPGTVLVTCQEKGKSTVTLPCLDLPTLAGAERPTCSLLVLRRPVENGTTPQVSRFEQRWSPESHNGSPVIMDYQL
jgi:tetratricopeptide (TPR) repeat protein